MIRNRAAPLLGPLIAMLVALLGLLAYLVQRIFPDAPRVTFGGFEKGSPHDVGMSLFTEYLLPFEVTSVLILIAILGAIVLAKKELE